MAPFVTLDGPLFKKIISIGYEFETHDLSHFKEDIVESSENEKVYQNTLACVRCGEGNVPVVYDKDGDSENKMIEMYIADDAGHYGAIFFRKLNMYANRIEYEDLVVGKTYTINSTPFNLENVTNDGQGIPILQGTMIDPPGKTFSYPLTPMTNYEIFSNDARGNDLNENMQMYFDDDGVRYLLNPHSSTFTGVEWNVTYRAVEPTDSIVSDTYRDACRRISEFMSSMKKQIVTVSSYLKYNEKKLYMPTKIGTPFYASFDGSKFLELGPITFKPQMTFCCHVNDAIDLVKAFGRMRQKKIIDILVKCTDIVVGTLTHQGNGTPHMRGYVFMALFLIHQYYLYAGSYPTIKYLKNKFSVMPRHKLSDLCKKINATTDTAFADALGACEDQLRAVGFYKDVNGNLEYWDLNTFLLNTHEGRVKISIEGIKIPSLTKAQRASTMFDLEEDDIVCFEVRSFKKLIKGLHPSTLKKFHKIKNTVYKKEIYSFENNL